MYCKGLSATLILWGLFQFSLPAQQVISAAGNQLTSQSGVSLEWTLGQVVYTTVSSDSIGLTQGFHQPTLEIITSLVEPAWENRIQVYPNPTSDLLIMSGSISETWNYQLLSPLGQPLQGGEWSGQLKEISLAGYPDGYYLLVVWRENRVVYQSRIIKNK